MVLEVAILDVKAEMIEVFKENFKEAEKIISAQHGYRKHSLLKCMEDQHRYLLLVYWDSIEDHEIGFRQSEDYKKWSMLLHHCYDPFPSVQHYQL